MKTATLSIIDMIVAFALITILLPLLFLWGILKFGQLVNDRGINFLPGN